MKEMLKNTDMKNGPRIIIHNQRGSVINVALLILILIFLVGIGLSKISTTDVKISSNMKTQATTFYEAEAGLDAAGEFIEQNLLCPDGFDDPDNDNIIAGYFFVNNLNFGYNRRDAASKPTDNKTDPHFFYPHDYITGTDPHTNVKLGGVTRFGRGSAIQMAAGYEGLGKGAAGGGGSMIFDVYVQRIGADKSTANHFMQWSHIIIPNVICNY